MQYSDANSTVAKIESTKSTNGIQDAYHQLTGDLAKFSSSHGQSDIHNYWDCVTTKLRDDGVLPELAVAWASERSPEQLSKQSLDQIARSPDTDVLSKTMAGELKRQYDSLSTQTGDGSKLGAFNSEQHTITQEDVTKRTIHAIETEFNHPEQALSATHQAQEAAYEARSNRKSEGGVDGPTEEVQKGEGYWHVAARLLKIDRHNASPEQNKRIANLAKQLDKLNGNKALQPSDKIKIPNRFGAKAQSEPTAPEVKSNAGHGSAESTNAFAKADRSNTTNVANTTRAEIVSTPRTADGSPPAQEQSKDTNASAELSWLHGMGRVAEDVGEGAWDMVKNHPGTLLKDAAIGAAVAVGATLLAPEIVAVAGVGALAYGAAKLYENGGTWLHEANVVAHQNDYSTQEVANAAQGLKEFGAGSAEIAAGLAGGLGAGMISSKLAANEIESAAQHFEPASRDGASGHTPAATEAGINSVDTAGGNPMPKPQRTFEDAVRDGQFRLDENGTYVPTDLPVGTHRTVSELLHEAVKSGQYRVEDGIFFPNNNLATGSNRSALDVLSDAIKSAQYRFEDGVFVPSD